MDISLSKLWEMVKDRDAWHAIVLEVERAGHDWATEQQWLCHTFKDFALFPFLPYQKYLEQCMHYGLCHDFH